MAKRRALLVGCNEYLHSRDLRFCHADVELLARTLWEECDYDRDEVVIANATIAGGWSRDAVLLALTELAAKTKEGDTALLFFAGHGTLYQGEPYILLPSSTAEDLRGTAIAVREVSDLMRSAQRVWVRIFDACHSGADVREATSIEPNGQGFIRELSSDAPSGIGWVTLASCASDQMSHEDPLLGHGIFTFSLCESIRQIAAGKAVAPGSLFDDLTVRVESVAQNHGWVQTPVMNSSLIGRLSIATRQVGRAEVPESPKEEPQLLDRLEAARATARDLVKHRESELELFAPRAQEVLAQFGSAFSEFGVETRVALCQGSALPKDLHPAIVKHFESLGVYSLHEIKSQQTSDDNWLTPISLGFPRRTRTEYRIFSELFPPTAAKMEWEGDDFAPSGCIFAYAIPLETQLYVIVGFRVHSFVNNRIHFTRTRFAKLEEQWSEYLTPPVRGAVELSHYRVAEAIRAKLNYLDAERQRNE